MASVEVSLDDEIDPPVVTLTDAPGDVWTLEFSSGLRLHMDFEQVMALYQALHPFFDDDADAD